MISDLTVEGPSSVFTTSHPSAPPVPPCWMVHCALVGEKHRLLASCHITRRGRHILIDPASYTARDGVSLRRPSIRPSSNGLNMRDAKRVLPGSEKFFL